MIHLLLSMTLFASPFERAEEVCPCHIRSEEIQQIIDQMIEIAPAGGLVAPQIGIQKRIVLLDKEAYIDPEIVWQGEKILIRAYNREANIVLREFEGEQARIFQRAIDDLDGKG